MKGVVWARWKLDWLGDRRRILTKREGGDNFVEAGLVLFMREAYKVLRGVKKKLRRRRSSRCPVRPEKKRQAEKETTRTFSNNYNISKLQLTFLFI